MLRNLFGKVTILYFFVLKTNVELHFEIRGHSSNHSSLFKTFFFLKNGLGTKEATSLRTHERAEKTKIEQNQY